MEGKRGGHNGDFHEDTICIRSHPAYGMAFTKFGAGTLLSPGGELRL